MSAFWPSHKTFTSEDPFFRLRQYFIFLLQNIILLKYIEFIVIRIFFDNTKTILLS